MCLASRELTKASSVLDHKRRRHKFPFNPSTYLDLKDSINLGFLLRFYGVEWCKHLVIFWHFSSSFGNWKGHHFWIIDVFIISDRSSVTGWSRQLLEEVEWGHPDRSQRWWAHRMNLGSQIVCRPAPVLQTSWHICLLGMKQDKIFWWFLCGCVGFYQNLQPIWKASLATQNREEKMDAVSESLEVPKRNSENAEKKTKRKRSLPKKIKSRQGRSLEISNHSELFFLR